MIRGILDSLNSKRIVLASGSPRRQKILKDIGLQFEIVTSNFEENLEKSSFTDPVDYVRETAKQKTLEVAKRLLASKPQSLPELIIGADTVIIHDDKIIEKPRSRESAIEILSRLSGRSHMVWTSVVLITQQLSDVFSGGNILESGLCCTQFEEKTEVKMGLISPQMMNSYIDTGEGMDKAGGYGIQALGGTFVESITGDYYNVVGFPLHRFCKEILKLHKG